jgi:hypothetical protein
VLRGEDADARTVAQLVDVIDHVDDVEAQRQRLHAGHGHVLRQPGIDLRGGRHVLGVGEARGTPLPFSRDANGPLHGRWADHIDPRQHGLHFGPTHKPTRQRKDPLESHA